MIGKLLKPNLTDCRCLLLCILFAATVVLGCLLATPELEPAGSKLEIYSLEIYYRNGLLAILIGLGLGAIQRNYHARSALLLAAIVLLAPWVAVGVHYLVLTYPLYQLFQLHWYQPNDELPYQLNRIVNDHGVAWCCTVIAIGVFYWLSNSRFNVSIKNPIKNSLPDSASLGERVRQTVEIPFDLARRLTANRKNFLIGTAVTLFALKILTDLRQMLPGVHKGQAASELIDLFFFLFLFALTLVTIRIFVNRKLFWLKIILAVVAVVALPAAIYLNWPYSLYFLGDWSTWIIYSLLLVLSFFAPRKSRVRQQPAAHPIYQFSWLPSLWSTLILGAVATTAWCAFQVDEAVLLATGDWQKATVAQKFYWRSAGRLKFLSGTLLIYLQEDSPADLLKLVAGEAVNSLSISGKGEAVDFKWLNTPTNPAIIQYADLSNCELNRRQWEQVVDLNFAYLVTGEMKIEAGDSKFTPASIQLLYVGDASVLDTIESWENVKYLNTSFEVSPQWWRRLSMISQTSNVNVQNVEVLPSPEDLKNATSQLKLNCARDVKLEQVNDLLNKTNIGNIYCWLDMTNESEQGLRLAIIHQQRLKLNLGSEAPSIIFNKDSTGRATALLVHLSSDCIENFPHLAVLSLDYSWVGLDDSNYYFNAPDLSTLTKLESLYLPMNVPYSLLYNGLNFDLGKLKTLQIAADYFSDNFAPTTAPNLQSLTLWGMPSEEALEGLLKLPALKNLAVIQTDEESFDYASEEGEEFIVYGLTPAKLKAACKKLPQLKLKIFGPNDPRPNPCPEFEQLRQQLIKENAAGGEPKQPTENSLEFIWPADEAFGSP